MPAEIGMARWALSGPKSSLFASGATAGTRLNEPTSPVVSVPSERTKGELDEVAMVVDIVLEISGKGYVEPKV